MLRNLRFRTKLMLLVAIPMIAALVVAVPGIRTRVRDLDASSSARALVSPSTRVRTFLQRVDDEGSLSAWWVASSDRTARNRLVAARRATDRAAADLKAAQADAADAGATDAVRGIRDLRETVALMDQQRQFVDLRLTPDESVLGYFRDLANDTTDVLDAFARSPDKAAEAVMFRDEATIARLERAISDERSVLVVAYARHLLSDTLGSDLVAAVTTQNAALDELQAQGRPATRAAIRTGTAALQDATDQVRQLRATALSTRALSPDVTAVQWYTASTRQLDGWQRLGTRIADGIEADLAQRHDHARSNLLVVGIGSLATLLLAAGLALLIARATTRPLRQLADNAHEVATRQLPALVDALHDPDLQLPTITPIVVRSRDELGALAKAFNNLERTTVEVAQLQREAVASGISELYVNLARRNQPLLARQLSLIEDLEHEERDSDRLGTLFTLDHLATRIRRNSESLLVLAGVDDRLTSLPPVPLLDVVRGAVSETTDFARIDTAGIGPDVEIVGYAASDLAHALSELLENATVFSTPASRVVVVTGTTDRGMELTISDEGIGIPPERLRGLNGMLARPPAPGLVLSRSLGLIVVARLAQRIGARVSLHSAPDIGTAAVMLLPDSIISDRHQDAIDLVAAESSEIEAAPSAGESVGDTAPAPRPPGADRTATRPTAVRGDDALAPLDADVLPGRARRLHRRPRTRRGETTSAVPAVAAPVVGEPTEELNREQPSETSDRASGDPGDGTAETTAAGLPRRTPRGDEAPEAPTVAAAPPSRPPDAVFELIARYEAGRRRARPEPTEGEEHP